jgi:hypothetical protein
MFAPLCAMAIAQLVSELRPEWFKAANEAFVAWLRASAS